MWPPNPNRNRNPNRNPNPNPFPNQREGVQHAVLERHDTVSATCERERWDSFRLVTENQLCALPDWPCTAIGQDPHGFMPKVRLG